jgi:hypothetical protein
MDLNLPKDCLVNKFIPKNTFSNKTTLTSRIKDDFTQSIQKITWKYKLSPETLSIPVSWQVEEIQVFEIELKEKSIPQNVLRVIDKLIPYPILYVFIYGDNFAYGITLKDDPNKSYYFSEWNEPIEFDFHAINLEKVYQNIIKKFIRQVSTESMSFTEVVATDKKISTLSAEILALKNKIQAEKQFKKKLELNRVLLSRSQELQSLQNI